MIQSQSRQQWGHGAKVKRAAVATAGCMIASSIWSWNKIFSRTTISHFVDTTNTQLLNVSLTAEQREVDALWVTEKEREEWRADGGLAKILLLSIKSCYTAVMMMMTWHLWWWNTGVCEWQRRRNVNSEPVSSPAVMTLCHMSVGSGSGGHPPQLLRDSSRSVFDTIIFSHYIRIGRAGDHSTLDTRIFFIPIFSEVDPAAAAATNRFIKSNFHLSHIYHPSNTSFSSFFHSTDQHHHHQHVSTCLNPT